MANAPAVEYLNSLLGRQLRIHTTDTRMFVGEMKCTDGVSQSSSVRLNTCLAYHGRNAMSFSLVPTSIALHQLQQSEVLSPLLTQTFQLLRTRSR